MTPDEIRAHLQGLQARDLPSHGGRTLAYVYDSGLAEADVIGREALSMFADSNGLDPTAFPSLLAMENDVVAMAGGLVDAPAGYVGSVTSGGTESVLLAVLAARDGAGAAYSTASMVLPTTAHAAFHKAAHYFGVEPILVDVEPTTFRANPDAMAAAIRDDTVLVVGSAPSYAHGVIDPIAELGALAAERGIRCHVDACIGGWVLPHLDGVAPWSFTVPGVTSISVDLHKYAYTPKGVSVLLHRDSSLRRGHFFAAANWPGYTMLNSTMQSTKSGGPLAAAWAVTRAIGIEGYAALARTARDATLAIAEGADGIPGLRVVVEPDSTLLAVATDESCDVFTIADEMLARGWYVQPQMSFRGMPPTLHLTLSAATAPSVPEFLKALGESVEAARAAGPAAVDPGLAQAAAALDPKALSDNDFNGLLALAGLASADGSLALPERMAPINALLDVAPPALREGMLLAFLDRLSRPS
ncbi:MAG: aminotransferase class V-fold PLP-dependent enzyme [Actinomycetales bacterium]|nr:aminotransferase class V-fold PLP-dependent enzyme [Actinomycetales bacterium]